MTDLLKAYALMKQEYSSVLKFYGEDATKARIDDFFSTFASFISDFEVTLCNCLSLRELKFLVLCLVKLKRLDANNNIWFFNIKLI